MKNFTNLKLTILLLILVHIIVFVVQYKTILTCNSPTCILLGGDTITQIHNYIKLEIPKLWIPDTNYGTNPLHPLPGLIVHAFMLKTIYTLTGGGMGLTFYIVEAITLSIGVIGLQLFLISLIHGSRVIKGKHNFVSNSGLLCFIIAALVFVINPGLWNNLLHGLIDYLLSYSITPWSLLIVYKLLQAIEVKRKKVSYEVVRYVIILIILMLLMFTHPISFSVMISIVLSYAVLHFFVNVVIGLKYFKNVLYNVAFVFFFALMLLLPYFYLYIVYVNFMKPSNEYIELLAYTHRDANFVLGWHVLSFIEALAMNDNTIAPLGSRITIVLSLLFSLVLVYIIMLWKKISRVNNAEIIIWLFLYMFFVTISMGTRAPYPFNQLNLVLFNHIPLIKVVGYPFRFAMASGFCLSILIGIFLSTLYKPINSKKYWDKLVANFTLPPKIIVIVSILLVLIIVGKFSALFVSLDIASPYYSLGTHLSKNNHGYVYIVPGSEWVIPYKLVNSTAIVKTYDGATVLPWPHNLLVYVLSMNNVPVTTGSYLRPYFDYVVKTESTDLLPLLFHYMNIRYIAIDGYVKPTIGWLEQESKVIKNQISTTPIASFGNIELLRVGNIQDNETIEYSEMSIYRHYGIVATNIFKFLLVQLVKNSTLDAYPIILDEETLPLISYLLDNAYYVVIDNAGFYDILVADMIGDSKVSLYNVFKIIDRGECNGKCRIEAMRLGWEYTGKPYYSIFDGVLLLGKGTSFRVFFNAPIQSKNIVLVRALVRGFGGYVTVNGINQKAEYDTNGYLYEPVWLKFVVQGNRININITAMNNMYIDCIIIAPYNVYMESLDKIIKKLYKTRLYMVLSPSDLDAERVVKTRFFGLGLLAQGQIVLNMSSYVNMSSRHLYIIGTNNETYMIYPNLKLISATQNFNKYNILAYEVPNNVNFVDISVPYAISNIKYIKQDSLLILHGYGSYLWFLPLKEINEYKYLTLQYVIDTKNYSRENAFGIALFHNLTHGYEVKFTYVTSMNKSKIYRVSLIERKDRKAYVIKAKNITVSNYYLHKVTIYTDLIHKEIIVSLNNAPVLSFKIKNLYGNLFGIIQWGKDAEIIIKNANAIMSETLESNYVYRQYNLLKVSSNNGIAGVVLENDIKSKIIDNKTLTIVYYQSYRKAWDIQLPKDVKLLAHLRGLYGITNIYIIDNNINSRLKYEKILNSSHFLLNSTKYVAMSIFLFVIYIIVAIYLTSRIRFSQSHNKNEHIVKVNSNE